MSIQNSAAPITVMVALVFGFVLSFDVHGATNSLERKPPTAEKRKTRIGKRKTSPKRSFPKMTDPVQAIDLSARSLRETVCKNLFNLRTTTPDALLKSPEVKILFVDLSRTQIAPGRWGKVVGISGGTSGTVEVEQPDGKTFYSERRIAERNGLKIRRVVQGPGGKIRIHKDLNPTREAAFVINHELGHVADKMYGDEASLLIDDAATTADVSKDLHQRNERTMAACKASLGRL
ncbi:MAG: hypothetical protein JNL64_01460 [Blastocatellia bacterium]|nr:hypothetical protein [Blastocatellia bacterium]